MARRRAAPAAPGLSNAQTRGHGHESLFAAEIPAWFGPARRRAALRRLMGAWTILATAPGTAGGFLASHLHRFLLDAETAEGCHRHLERLHRSDRAEERPDPQFREGRA